MNYFTLEIAFIIVLSMSLWHVTDGGAAADVTRLDIISHSCNGRNPVFYYVQIGYATPTIVTWDGSDARRDCTEVERYLDWSRIITGWRYRCEQKTICTATLKLLNGNLRDQQFQDCCNIH
ncbi:uncharacterized protein [Mytilus edulis]|uniref:uncharacterized protein n=1 Tax=Mytilus edulis TaxID=6550 RepID=UPI0039EDFD01